MALDERQLALVRFQNRVPVNGKLESLHRREGFARKTLHFSLNCIPPDVNRESFNFSWRNHDVMLICSWTPFLEANGPPKGGNVTDLFWLDGVRIPDESKVVVRMSAWEDSGMGYEPESPSLIRTESTPSSLLPDILNEYGASEIDTTFMRQAFEHGKEEEIAGQPAFREFVDFSVARRFIATSHSLTYARMFEGFVSLLKTLQTDYDDGWFIQKSDFRAISLSNCEEMLSSTDRVRNAAGTITELWGDVMEIVEGIPRRRPSEILALMEEVCGIRKSLGLKKQRGTSDSMVLAELDFWFPHSEARKTHLQKLSEAYAGR
jgi:hypothetical protein